MKAMRKQKKERGAFVSYNRRPELKGLVIDSWNGSVAWTSHQTRLSVVWSNGMTSSVTLGLDATPCAPFEITPKMRAALRDNMKRANASVAAFSARAAWLASVLGETSRGKS